MASTLTVDTIQGSTNADNVKLPKGCIVQVEQTFYDTNTTSFSHSEGDVSLYSVNITPKFATSKILVTIDISVSHLDNYSALIRCKRDNTYIGGGQVFSTNNAQFTNVWFNVRSPGGTSNNANCALTCSQSFLDSPATTSQLTYTVMGRQSGDPGGIAAYVNRPVSMNNAAYASSSASTITVMEIAQ